MAAPVRIRPITDWDDVPVVMDLTMAARVLGINHEALRRQCHSGKFPAVKIGDVWRVNKRDLMRHLGLEV